MKNYIGIDLGTTNSAICAFNGEKIRLFKSPEQNDVTPSALFFDKRGNKYVGKRAYDQAARNPGNSATLFKRLMGTSTQINLSAVNLSMSPEECSAEILRVLFGYLPEEIRNDSGTGTVITVPAAFNQMQKDATLAAAEMAALGNVALMQEPVAAVMSVMRLRNEDGAFLIYDIGGGTLDIAIAESTKGRVSLISHGGIAMCGGRDFDRLLFDNIVKPWLFEKFDLPQDFISNKRYAILRSLGTWATEKAKIDLSSFDESVISLDDSELRIRDESGADIYLDISINRSNMDKLIALKIEESIVSVRETMEKATLNPHDIGRIVFIGGPAQYKPLRDKVAFELGIDASVEVNPMTAVAEGAALFAESIDWTSKNRGRKSGRGTIAASSGIDISFNYQSRTTDRKAKIVAILGGQAASGTAFQIDCLDTGWSSGKVALSSGASIDVPLAKAGENYFKIYVFDSAGGPIKLVNDKIIITKTAAQIDAIPASNTVFVEAFKKIGGPSVPVYLVRDGEQLPKKGTQTFKSEETLRAGSPGSINFKLWEGDIKDPITDNRFIGMFEIKGSDFSDDVIVKGADLICDYEILDSGKIILEVTVPSIKGSFRSGQNFYIRRRDFDYSNIAKLLEDESGRLASRLTEISTKVDDPRLCQARERLDRAIDVTNNTYDPEIAKQAMDDIQEAKKLLARTREENLPLIRRIELDRVVNFFNIHVREYARPTELSSIDNLIRTAQRAIDNNSIEFESYINDIRGRGFMVLWRQDWFVIDRFKWLSEESFLFPDLAEHAKICEVGRQALQSNDIEKLRQIVIQLDTTRVVAADEDEMIARSNILAE